MKVGMYNRWLATLGGGEMYSLTIAEILSQKHDVEVISHSEVSREDAAQRLNLDLARVKFVQIPSSTSDELKPLTGEYDLFINASFMDYIPSIAPQSAAIIYFPTPLNGLSTSRRRHRFGWAVKRWLMVPTLAEGFLCRDATPEKPYAIITSAPLRIKLPTSRKAYQVSFSLESLVPEIGTVALRLDNQPSIQISLRQMGSSLPLRIEVPESNKPVHELVIEMEDSSADWSSAACFRLDSLTVQTSRFKFFQMIFSNRLSSFGLRFQLLPLPRSSILESLDTYNALWAISKYTHGWIRRYWNRESVVLYPPVDVNKFNPAQKTKKILNVGRFFAGAHNKKHMEMIRAFREMVDAGLREWELYLVGGSRTGDVHQKYLGDVITAAKGYPIHVLPDLPYSSLVPLYNESSIYWHASGYGEDENRDPVKSEHFGITTVEAMAAGCVPVVIAKGGQPEIVQHGKNGYLWNNLEELKSYTNKLISDANLCQNLSASAVNDSRRYSVENFHSNLLSLLDNIGIQNR